MNPAQQSVRNHKRRCIAAYLHERTKQGKPTTIREAAAAYGWNPKHINSIVWGMIGDVIETTYGPVTVQHVGKRTSTGGVTANIYAAILHYEKSEQ